MSAVDNLKEPRDTGTDQWQRFATVVDENVYFVVLRDVIPFTWYCIRVLGFTRKGDGPESSCEFILTEEGGKVKQWRACRYNGNTHGPFNFICSCCDYDGLVTRSKSCDDIQLVDRDKLKGRIESSHFLHLSVSGPKLYTSEQENLSTRGV